MAKLSAKLREVYPAYEIFISYRQGDRNAIDLKRALDERFYPEVSFRDMDSVDIGPLDQVIKERIRKSRFVLFLISRPWIATADRLGQPHDYVRQEIEETLRERKDFIPVAMGNSNVRTEFQATFFDGSSGTLLAGKPDFINDMANRPWVELNIDNAEQTRAGLLQLFKKLEMGLPGHWRRQAHEWQSRARWRWPAYFIFLLLTAIMIVGLIAFCAGYSVQYPDQLVVYRARYDKELVDLKPRDYPPNVDDESTPLKKKHQNWMDFWLATLAVGVDLKDSLALQRMKPDEKDQYSRSRMRIMVSETFGKNYRTFSAALNTGPGFVITDAAVFLVRNNGLETSYSPVYRQMVVNIDEGTPPRHNLTLVDPNSDEAVLVLAVIKNKKLGEPVPSNVPLKMETHP